MLESKAFLEALIYEEGNLSKTWSMLGKVCDSLGPGPWGSCVA